MSGEATDGNEQMSQTSYEAPAVFDLGRVVDVTNGSVSGSNDANTQAFE